MRLIIAIVLVMVLTIIPCQALTLFQADYDNHIFVETIVYEDLDWLPLRELSNVLPYEVGWDGRYIWVYANRTWKIDSTRLPYEVKIVNGVTYCSPRYMQRFLSGIDFRYQGELYVFAGEIGESSLIRGSESFRVNAITSMYRLKLVSPDTYEMVRECLTGGIESVELDTNVVPLRTLAYVYPHRKKPTAYIIGEPNGSLLVECIVHEAFHVKQYRSGVSLDEKDAKEAGMTIYQQLIESIE